jgi:hypothetical protein
MKDGWGERMWVTITAVKKRHLIGLYAMKRGVVS